MLLSRAAQPPFGAHVPHYARPFFALNGFGRTRSLPRFASRARKNTKLHISPTSKIFAKLQDVDLRAGRSIRKHVLYTRKHGESMRKCACGNQVANNARTCPKCGHRFTSGPVLFLAWFLGISIGLGLLAAILGQSNESSSNPITDSKGRAVPVGVSNDAELLIARCGQPSSDDSTDHDNPRPPIPSRIVEYKKQRLRFLFIPGGGSKLGDPPPYKWKFVGVTDMTAANPSKARVVNPSEAVRRMPCWSGN
jgi:hypothetical protein